jgi:hypothetical protein
MKDYYSIYFFDGKSMPISREELTAINKQISAGAEYIQLRGNLINKKNIARAGEHSSTAYLKNLERASTEHRLLTNGKTYLVEDRKDRELVKATNNILKIQKMEEEEYEKELRAIDTAPMYYLDKETGEKMYS